MIAHVRHPLDVGILSKDKGPAETTVPKLDSHLSGHSHRFQGSNLANINLNHSSNGPGVPKLQVGL